jgi:tRNA nucleotidyltransferase/poly(A) polymerase
MSVAVARRVRAGVSADSRRIVFPVNPYVASLLRDIATVDTPYIVGGVVRDFLMGAPSYDVDIAVRDFDRVVEHLKGLGYKVSEEARSFRVVKVMLDDGEVVDVAGFRTEEYDMVSRKPRVAPVETIEDDLSRRDFTVNAMAIRVLDVGPDRVVGELVDPFGGYADLRAGVVRAVRNAVARIMEDPLRILRALRFAVKLGFSIDRELWEAIGLLHPELRRVSAERIRDELNKMLLADPARAVELVWESGVWRTVMPFLGPMAAVRHDSRAHHHGETVLEHTVEALRNLARLHEPDLRSVLAVLLHDAGKPAVVREVDGKVMFVGHAETSAEIARKWLRAMRYDSRTVRLVSEAVRLHEMVHNARGSRKALAKLWVEEASEDPEVMELAIRVAEADKGERYDDVRQLIEEFKTYPKPRGWLVLDLPPRARGYVLRKLRVLQLTQGISDPEELRKLARGISIPKEKNVET